MTSINDIKNYFKNPGLTAERQREIEIEDQQGGFTNEALDFYSENDIEQYEGLFKSINSAILNAAKNEHIVAEVAKVHRFNYRIWVAAAVLMAVVFGAYFYAANNGSKPVALNPSKQPDTLEKHNVLPHLPAKIIEEPITVAGTGKKDTTNVFLRNKIEPAKDDGLLGLSHKEGTRQDENTCKFSLTLVMAAGVNSQAFTVLVWPGGERLTVDAGKKFVFKRPEKTAKVVLQALGKETDTIYLTCNDDKIFRVQ